jgi:hypothetical protein
MTPTQPWYDLVDIPGVFDAWHVGTWQQAWCNRCAQDCTSDVPCDCCDLDGDDE